MTHTLFFSALAAVLLSLTTAEMARAEDNAIIIKGKPTGWCSGIGQAIVRETDGSATCSCETGWAKIEEEDEDGQPGCGYIIDGGEPIDIGVGDDQEPPGSGTGGAPDPGGTEPPPTLAQCATMNRECVRRASTLTENCHANRRLFYGHELANGRPCHGQTLEELLDGFQYRILWAKWSCKPEDFFNVAYAYTDNCRKQARIRGMGRCVHGVKGVSTTSGASDSYQSTLSTPIYSQGRTRGTSFSISFSAPAGMGSDQACKALGTAAGDVCAQVLTDCEATARETYSSTGTSPSLGESGSRTEALNTGGVMAGTGTATGPDLGVDRPEAPANEGLAPPTLAERFLERIDRDRLGIAGDGARAVPGVYQLLARGELEAEPLYLARLRFLARWSEFLNRYDIQRPQQAALETLMSGWQARMHTREERYSRLLDVAAWVDMRSGTQGVPQAEVLMEDFERGGSIWMTYLDVQKAVFDDLPGILGAAPAADFVATVWPGAVRFSYAAPFASGPPVLAQFDPFAPVD